MLLMSIFHPDLQEGGDVSVILAQFYFPALLPLFHRVSCSFLSFAFTDDISGCHLFPGSSPVLLKRLPVLFQYVSCPKA